MDAQPQSTRAVETRRSLFPPLPPVRPASPLPARQHVQRSAPRRRVRRGLVQAVGQLMRTTAVKWALLALLMFLVLGMTTDAVHGIALGLVALRFGLLR